MSISTASRSNDRNLGCSGSNFYGILSAKMIASIESQKELPKLMSSCVWVFWQLAGEKQSVLTPE
jgi:hypothetical protein